MLIIAMTVIVGSLQAQAPTGIPEVDSAAVARVAWGRMQDALKHDDVPGARAAIARAASAWPTQPAYPWAQALLAAQAGDSVAALGALTRFLDLGLGRVITPASPLERFARWPPFAAALRRLRDQGLPLARSRTAVSTTDSTFWPEGVDYEPASRSYFLAGVRHGTIAQVRADGSVRYLWPPDAPGTGAVLGVRVDTLRGILWATISGIPQRAGYLPADSAIAALLRIRVADGAIERRWDLPPVPGGHVLGDLAVGPDGDVYFTDSNQPVLYRLRPNGDTLEHISHPLFRSLQGLAPSPDGRDLYLTDYSHGLLRVRLATGTVTRVADAPGSTSLGCDGIAWDRGTIIAVQNGVTPARVIRFILDPTGDRIARLEVLDRNTPLAPEPTIGTVVGRRFVYVANGQWDEYDDDGHLNADARLEPARLVAVPLDDLEH